MASRERRAPRLSRDNLRYVTGAPPPIPSRALRRLLHGEEPPGALLRLCSNAPGQLAHGQQPAGQDPAILTEVAAQLDEILAEVRALVRGPSVGAAPRKGADLDRTEFLHEFLPGLLGAAVIPWAAVERLTDPRHAGVDDTLVAAYEDMASALWQAFVPASKRERLLAVVGQQAAAVRDVLRGPMTDSQRRRLYEVSVGLHAEAGIVGLQLHELDAADGFFALARATAEDSRDDRLQAQALQISTHLLSSLRYGGRGGDDDLALARIEQAAAYAANADPHTKAETFRRLAEQRALNRDAPGFRLALEQAYQEFGRIDGSEHGFSAQSGGFLSPWLLHATAGMGHMVLERHSQALRELRAAVRDPAINPRSAVDLRADMARVWVQLDEPEQACGELTAALKATETMGGHPMGIQRIRGVRASFSTPWTDLDCVRELDQRLRPAA